MAFEVKLDKDLLEYRDSPLYTSTKQQIGIDLLNLFDREPRPDSAGRLGSRGGPHRSTPRSNSPAATDAGRSPSRTTR